MESSVFLPMKSLRPSDRLHCRLRNTFALTVIYFSISGLFAGPDADPKTTLAEADRLAWLKNWTKAEPLFQKAEEGFKTDGDRRNELYARVGKLRGELRSKSPQIISHEVALLMADPLVQTDKALRLRCVTVKGDADLDTDSNLAQRDWKEALELSKDLVLADWESRANGELGIIAFLHGDTGAAMLQVGLALRHAVAAHDLGAEIRYRTMAGQGMSELGQGDAALIQFDKAIDLATNNKDLGMPLLAFSGKATALVRLNRYPEARSLLNQALAIARNDANLGYQADLLTQLGLLESKAGDRKRAVADLEEAAKLATAANGYRLVAQADYELSKLYESPNETLNRQRVLISGVAASRQIGDQYFLPRYLAQYAEFEASQHRYVRAEALFDEATDIVNGMLVNVSGPNAESDLIGAMNEIYLQFFRLEAELGHTQMAFAVLEQARGRATADLLKAPTDATRKSADLTTQEQTLSALQLQLWKPQSRLDRKKLLEKIFDAEQGIGPLEVAGRRRNARQVIKPTSASGVRARLGSTEALIEFFIDAKASYAFVLTKGAMALRKLNDSREVIATVNAHIEAISSHKSIDATGRKLYAMLLQPVQVDISSKRDLIISPDGDLHRLPFETLFDSTGRLLLQDVVVSYTPSATVLALLRQPTSAPRPALPLLAVSSSPKPPQVAGAAAAGPASGVTRGVFDADDLQLRPLPAANDEVRSIALVLGKQSVVLTDATEAQFKAQELDRFRVIHLALHGLVSTKMPERSALVFQPDPRSNEDGFLQAREISRLPLRADLVTLSACETGSGKINGQEGVENLARPFLFAGAKSVLANLWDVDDEFSRGLMKRFYSNLVAGQEKASALNAAKVSMIHDYGDQAPAALWSGFVLFGDGSGRVFLRRTTTGD
jgi:CHAT domain-containing protein